MNALQATILRPGDHVTFHWRRILGKTIGGTVLSVSHGVVRIEWDDDWINAYQFDDMEQITKDESND